MRSIALSIIILALGWNASCVDLEAALNTGSYAFDGDFESAFTQTVEAGSGSWIQEGGVGKYLSPDTSFAGAVLRWNPYTLPYDSDWSISLDIEVPSFYESDLMADMDFGEEFVMASLGVAFPTEAGVNAITTGLRVLSPFGDGTWRQVVGENRLADESAFVTSTFTSLEVITAQMNFDSETKILTFGYEDEGDFISLSALDLEDPDEGWGMLEEDHFVVFIEGMSNLNEVLPDYPITVDLLAADGALAIPEPETMVLLAGVSAIGLVVFRRFRGKS